MLLQMVLFYFFFFYGWVIVHCMCVLPLLYPFFCQWTFRFIHVLAIVNSAAMNTRVYMSFWTKPHFPPDMCPGVGWLDHMVSLFLVFWGTSLLCSIVVVPVYIPTSGAGGFLFPIPSLAFFVYRRFNDGHSDWHEGVPHCSFDLHVSNN